MHNDNDHAMKLLLTLALFFVYADAAIAPSVTLSSSDVVLPFLNGSYILSSVGNSFVVVLSSQFAPTNATNVSLAYIYCPSASPSCTLAPLFASPPVSLSSPSLSPYLVSTSCSIPTSYPCSSGVLYSFEINIVSPTTFLIHQANNGKKVNVEVAVLVTWTQANSTSTSTNANTILTSASTLTDVIVEFNNTVVSSSAAPTPVSSSAAPASSSVTPVSSSASVPVTVVPLTVVSFSINALSALFNPAFLSVNGSSTVLTLPPSLTSPQSINLTLAFAPTNFGIVSVTQYNSCGDTVCTPALAASSSSVCDTRGVACAVYLSTGSLINLPLASPLSLSLSLRFGLLVTFETSAYEMFYIVVTRAGAPLSSSIAPFSSSATRASSSAIASSSLPLASSSTPQASSSLTPSSAPVSHPLSSFVSGFGVLHPSYSASNPVDIVYSLSLDVAVTRVRFWMSVQSGIDVANTVFSFLYYEDARLSGGAVPLLVSSMNRTAVSGVTSFLSLLQPVFTSTPVPTLVNPRIVVVTSSATSSVVTTLLTISLTFTSSSFSSFLIPIVDCLTTGVDVMDPVLYTSLYDFRTDLASMQCPPVSVCDWPTLSLVQPQSLALIGGGGGGGGGGTSAFYATTSIVCQAAVQCGAVSSSSANASIVTVDITPSYFVNAYTGTSSHGIVSVGGAITGYSLTFLLSSSSSSTVITPSVPPSTLVYSESVLPLHPATSFSGGRIYCDSTAYTLNIVDSTPNTTFIVQCPVWSLCSTLLASQYVVDIGVGGASGVLTVSQDSAICMIAYQLGVLSKTAQPSAASPTYTVPFTVVIQPPPPSFATQSSDTNKKTSWSLSSTSTETTTTTTTTGGTSSSFSVSVSSHVPIYFWQISSFSLCNLTSGVHTRSLYCMASATGALANPKDPSDEAGVFCTLEVGAGTKPPKKFPCSSAETSYWDVRGLCLSSIGYGTGKIGCYSRASPSTRLVELDCQSSVPFPTSNQLRCPADSWVPYVIEFSLFTFLLVVVAVMIVFMPRYLALPALSALAIALPSLRTLPVQVQEVQVQAQVQDQRQEPRQEQGQGQGQEGSRRLFPEAFVPLRMLLCDKKARALLMLEILRSLQTNHPLYSSMYPSAHDPFNRFYRLSYLCSVLCSHFSLQAWVTYACASTALTDELQTTAFLVAAALGVVVDLLLKLMFKHTVRPSLPLSPELRSVLQVCGHIIICLCIVAFIVSLVFIVVLSSEYIQDVFVQWLASTALSFMGTAAYLTAAVLFFNQKAVQKMNRHTRKYSWTQQQQQQHEEEEKKKTKKEEENRDKHVVNDTVPDTLEASVTPASSLRTLNQDNTIELCVVPPNTSSPSSSLAVASPAPAPPFPPPPLPSSSEGVTLFHTVTPVPEPITVSDTSVGEVDYSKSQIDIIEYDSYH